MWTGPGTILTVEGAILWINMMGELWRVSAEQTRHATYEERMGAEVVAESFEEMRERLTGPATEMSLEKLEKMMKSEVMEMHMELKHQQKMTCFAKVMSVGVQELDVMKEKRRYLEYRRRIEARRKESRLGIVRGGSEIKIGVTIRARGGNAGSSARTRCGCCGEQCEARWSSWKWFWSRWSHRRASAEELAPASSTQGWRQQIPELRGVPSVQFEMAIGADGRGGQGADQGGQAAGRAEEADHGQHQGQGLQPGDAQGRVGEDRGVPERDVPDEAQDGDHADALGHGVGGSDGDRREQPMRSDSTRSSSGNSSSDSADTQSDEDHFQVIKEPTPESMSQWCKVKNAETVGKCAMDGLPWKKLERPRTASTQSFSRRTGSLWRRWWSNRRRRP